MVARSDPAIGETKTKGRHLVSGSETSSIFFPQISVSSEEKNK